MDGRIELPFVLPSDSPTPYERYALSEDYEFRESTLRYDAVTDVFYLNISMRRYDSDRAEVSADTEHQTVLGIDLGVNSLAVASTGTFWQGDDYDHWCREFEKRRGRCNSAGRKPRTTRSFDLENAKKRGESSTSIPSPTRLSQKPSNAAAT